MARSVKEEGERCQLVTAADCQCMDTELEKMTNARNGMLGAIMRRPAVVFATVTGIVLVIAFFWMSSSVLASSHGCIDQETGRQKAEEIAGYRKKAAQLRSRSLESHYRSEAQRQKEWNGDAERRCGQPGVPFDLAMRHLDAMQGFLGVLASVIFGFCTLASVLVTVALRDEDEDRMAVGLHAPAAAVPMEQPVLSGQPCHRISSLPVESTIPGDHPVPEGSDADHHGGSASLNSAHYGIAPSAGAIVIGLAIGLSASIGIDAIRTGLRGFRTTAPRRRP